MYTPWSARKVYIIVVQQCHGMQCKYTTTSNPWQCNSQPRTTKNNRTTKNKQQTSKLQTFFFQFFGLNMDFFLHTSGYSVRLHWKKTSRKNTQQLHTSSTERYTCWWHPGLGTLTNYDVTNSRGEMTNFPHNQLPHPRVGRHTAVAYIYSSGINITVHSKPYLFCVQTVCCVLCSVFCVVVTVHCPLSSRLVIWRSL